MINNLEHIIPFLDFRTDDDFYHLQILKRKKEHPELGSNSRIIKTYYVTSVEMLKDNMGEIKLLCDFHNSRAYFNLNRRSFEKVAKHVHLKIAHQILMNEDYRSVKK